MSNIKINLDSLNTKSYKKTVRHKVKDGENVYRFLPPFGPESNGYPYQKWNVVWGLVDPNSGRMRPFASSSTYEGQCPVYDYLELLKQKLDTIQDEDKIKKINEYISAIRPKSVYAYNAADKSGQVGVLELKSTAHKKVITLMDKYIKAYNQDPTSLNSAPTDSGVWFNISRAGKGFDTTYDAAKNQTMEKDENGIPSFKDDRSPLAENIVQNYEELAYDLSNLYQKLSYNELKDVLVANIIHAASDLPELLVPGFGLEEAQADVVQPAPSVNVPQGNGNVNLNLGQQEDAKPTAAKSNDTEDILAMADDIFNS